MPNLTAEEWRDQNDDLAWVRAQRSELEDLGFDVPTSLGRLDQWLGHHKGAVTKALNAQADENADEED